ncbi:uncharacterized protein LOC124366798 [Homalodisca vitripennis]|uniref:uncharacterized protein LOC124366798 n=1 Tax=Homalodisca vitripennis TaxID=197043 RepID=UPI001EEC214E|nr:uncharacterized protein LOC124366798 [Homalodisca vitripennis]
MDDDEDDEEETQQEDTNSCARVKESSDKNCILPLKARKNMSITTLFLLLFYVTRTWGLPSLDADVQPDLGSILEIVPKKQSGPVTVPESLSSSWPYSIPLPAPLPFPEGKNSVDPTRNLEFQSSTSSVSKFSNLCKNAWKKIVNACQKFILL